MAHNISITALSCEKRGRGEGQLSCVKREGEGDLAFLCEERERGGEDATVLFEEREIEGTQPSCVKTENVSKLARVMFCEEIALS